MRISRRSFSFIKILALSKDVEVRIATRDYIISYRESNGYVETVAIPITYDHLEQYSAYDYTRGITYYCYHDHVNGGLFGYHDQVLRWGNEHY